MSPLHEGRRCSAGAKAYFASAGGHALRFTFARKRLGSRTWGHELGPDNFVNADLRTSVPQLTVSSRPWTSATPRPDRCEGSQAPGHCCMGPVDE